jgi:hypothetical protein
VSPVRYYQGFYIPEDGILHSHRRENLESYIALTACALWRRRNVSTVKYELSLYISEGDILHSHHRENFKSCKNCFVDNFYIRINQISYSESNDVKGSPLYQS